MANGNSAMPMNAEMRNREVVPGVFVPFPDSEESVREDARQELRQKAAQDNDEPDPTCDDAIDEGLDEQTLNSYRGVRQWVMCTAWQRHRQDGIPFGEAVDSAWSDVDMSR